MDKENATKIPSNVNLADILNSILQIDDVMDFVIKNNVVEKHEKLVKYIKEIKISYITIIDNLVELNEYIERELTDDSGIRKMIKILQTMYQISTISKEYGDLQFNKFMVDDIYDIINSLYYLSFIATSNEKKINEGLDILIGEDTSAYIPLLQENQHFDFSRTNNESLIYKYFLVNSLLSKLIKTNTQNTWFFKLLKQNIRFKISIKTILGTLEFFYKKSKDLIKEANKNKDIDSILGNISRNILSISSFMSFLDNMMDRDMGFIVRFKMRRSIKRVLNIYKYFIKSINKISKEFKEIIDTQPLEPLQILVDSIVNVVQTVDIVTKMGYFKSRRATRRIKKMLKYIICTPLDLLKEYNASEQADSLSTLKDIIKDVVSLVDEVSNIKVSIVGIKKFFWFIEYFIKQIGNLRITDKKQEKILKLSEIFKGVLEITETIKNISIISGYLILFTTVTIPLLLFAVHSLNKININKKTYNNISQLSEIIKMIHASITPFVTSLIAIGALGPIVMLGVLIAITSITMLVTGYIGISLLVKKFRKDINNSNKTLLGITTTLSAFTGILAKLSLSAAALAISISIIMTTMMLFLGEYITMSKIVVKFKRIIKNGEKLLLSISSTLLLFSKSINELSQDPKNKPNKDTILSLLLFSASVGIILGIMFLLNKVSRITKKGAVVLLMISGVLLAFVGMIVLISMIISGLNTLIFIVLTAISLVVLSIIGICILIKKKMKDILIGLAILSLIVVGFIGISLAMKYIYQNIISITDWIAFGFLFANIIAMTTVSVLVGFILINTGSIAFAVIGILSLIGITWGFVLISVAIGEIYNNIRSVTDWEALGFLFANIIAMAVCAAAVGAAILLTAGLGAAAIATGVAAMIGITYSFIEIGKNIGELYNLLPGDSSSSEDKMKALIKPLEVITDWVDKTSWDTILWLPKGVSALIKTSEKLPIIAKHISSIDYTKLNDTNNSVSGMIDNLIKIDEINNGGYNKFINDNIRFLDKANSVDTDKIKSVRDMFEQMARFSESVSGNFKELADVLSNELIEILEKLNTTMEGIKNGTSDISKTVSTTSAVTPAAPVQQKQAVEQNKQVSVDIASNINRIKSILETFERRGITIIAE